MTDTADLPLRKKTMRAHQVMVRRRACADGGAEAALRLAALAPALAVAPGTVVGAYWPMGDEIDPRPLMQALARAGCRLCLPVVTAPAQPLDFRAFAFGDELVPGRHGTLHPLDVSPPAIPEMLLVPLLAFDRGCFRLGYGGGYYDRTLESLRKNAQVRTVGLAFAAQRVDAVPRDGHDQRLDAIATENGLLLPETV